MYKDIIRLFGEIIRSLNLGSILGDLLGDICISLSIGNILGDKLGALKVYWDDIKLVNQLDLGGRFGICFFQSFSKL